VRPSARVAGRFPRRVVGAASTPMSLRVEFLMTKPFLLVMSFFPFVQWSLRLVLMSPTGHGVLQSPVRSRVRETKSRLGVLGGLGWFAG